MSGKNGVTGTGQSAVLNLDPMQDSDSQDQADLIRALAAEVAQLRTEVKSLRSSEGTALKEHADNPDATLSETEPPRREKRRISAKDLTDIFD